MVKTTKAAAAAEGHPSKPARPPKSRSQMTVHQGGQTEAHREPSQPVSETVALMQMMERIATNPAVDVEKMKQVRELGQQVLNDHRRAAFDDALAQMQAKLPTIDAKGRLEIRARDAAGGRSGAVLQSTPYARWEDINEVIKPILREHGFGLRFETGLAEGRVIVTGILSGHGHREKAEFALPHDSTGSKNAVQAIGSSTSYGKRYAASALLNLTSRGEDDNGKKGGGKPLDAGGFPGDRAASISSDQVTALVNKMKEVGCPRDKFLNWAGVALIEEIPADDFEFRMNGLVNFRKGK